jgi:galacturonosyltransferase
MREKGIDQYLEAAEYIRDKYPNTRFHICGYCEEDYQDKLKELSDKNVILYHGCIRDVREMHKISSCTIHPTYYPEGLSNVLLESLACCRPIITTDRSGCREVVDDNINGFIVKQNDTEDLIRKIEKFLALSHEEKMYMGLVGRKKVEREFDRTIVVNKYINEINIVAGAQENGL